MLKEGFEAMAMSSELTQLSYPLVDRSKSQGRSRESPATDCIFLIGGTTTYRLVSAEQITRQPFSHPAT
jgi:hypothetical protein